MRAFVIAIVGLSSVFLMCFLEPLATSGAVSGTLRAAIIFISLATVVVAARTTDRPAALLIGGAIGLLMPVLFWEGRWLAHLSGWSGLEIDRFLSAIGEMPVSAGEAQMLALLVGVISGIPCAVVGAVVGWVAGRRSNADDAARPTLAIFDT